MQASRVGGSARQARYPVMKHPQRALPLRFQKWCAMRRLRAAGVQCCWSTLASGSHSPARAATTVPTPCRSLRRCRSCSSLPQRIDHHRHCYSPILCKLQCCHYVPFSRAEVLAEWQPLGKGLDKDKPLSIAIFNPLLFGCTSANPDVVATRS